MALPFPILSADEAASFIEHGQTVGFSGFTPAGAVKAIPMEIAKRAREEHVAGRQFKIGVLTGASTGKSLDGALAEAMQGAVLAACRAVTRTTVSDAEDEHGTFFSGRDRA